MVGNSCSGKSDPIGEPTAESFPLRGSSCANLGFEAKQLQADGRDGCAGWRFASKIEGKLWKNRSNPMVDYHVTHVPFHLFLHRSPKIITPDDL